MHTTLINNSVNAAQWAPQRREAVPVNGSYEEQTHGQEPEPAKLESGSDQMVVRPAESDEGSETASTADVVSTAQENALVADHTSTANSELAVNDNDIDAHGPAEPGTAGDVAAENARLRDENARLQHELGTLGTVGDRTTPGRARRIRRVSVGILVVLTCLGLLLSTVTLWVNNQFLNTDNWVALVGPLGQNPQVVNAISAYAANEVVSVLDVQQRAQEALPPRAQFLAAPLASVIHDYTQKAVAKLMHTPQFGKVWVTTNRFVQSEVLAALRGQTKNVIVTNGTVTLNLIPILSQVMQTLQQSLSGLIPANVHFPDVSQLQIPSQARARLSQALGIQLPADFGTITLFSSESLAQAQQLLRLFDLLTVLLPIITVLLLVATIWLSLDRRRSLVQLGIGIAITFLIACLVIGYLEGRVVDAIAHPTGRSIAGVVIPSALGGLVTATVLLLIAGVVAALIAFLVGKPEWFAVAYAQGKSGYGYLHTGYGRVRDEVVKRRTGASGSDAIAAPSPPSPDASAARDP
jgi:hypothetical protein